MERDFSGAELLLFHRIFGDATPLKDQAGNEIRPRQMEKPMWRRVYLSDSLLVMQALPVLSEGRETPCGSFPHRAHDPKPAAGDPGSRRPGPIREVLQEQIRLGREPTTGHFLIVQGEDAAYRSSPSLFQSSIKAIPPPNRIIPQKFVLIPLVGTAGRF